ncbi:hypothetical protein FKR81_29900 [Lentzea tibetensis]|uniref:Uncharacterized protein n=1 Tax=Lentzea tibetensis TaxID=2591470 RepID=A0A563EM73_9PSEU|nr:hypothetical protein [Lentzea tibetensis]TWP48190.1 hypothetical protein FKR81_29900 [Lentzea tibetensis]
MDVDRGLWWSVTWPWLVIWVLTVAAVVAVAAMVVVRGMALWRGRGEPEQDVPGLLFYVHGERVINLCKVGRYDDAVTRQFVEQITVTKDGRLQVGPSEFGIGAGGSVQRQTTNTYEKPATEIDVIGVVLAGLQSANGVVHADLTKRSIRADTAWRRARPARLSDIRDYVSLDGRFELSERTGDSVVLLAPIGEQRVRVECDDKGLRDTRVPGGLFNARCIGKVQSWNAATGEIVVLPVVIFQ